MSARAVTFVNWIRFAALVVAIGLAAAIGLAFAPTMFGRQVMVVTTGSMEPWAPVGSIVITRMVDARTVAVGDVITFREAESMPTTHRVIEITERDATSTTFLTKGDANEDVDPTPVRIAGEVALGERAIPGLGRILVAIRSPIAFLALVLMGLSSAALEKAINTTTIRPRVRPMLT